MRLYEKKTQYSKDYEVREYTDEKGKKRTKVEYVGPLIPFRTEKDKALKCFIAVAVLTVVLIVSLVQAELLQHASAWFIGVSIPLACAFFPCMYLIMGVCTLQFNIRPMHRDRYTHSIVRIFKSCAAIIPLSAVSIGADILYRAIYKDWLFLSGDIWFLILIAIVIISAVAIILIMRNVEIDERALK